MASNPEKPAKKAAAKAKPARAAKTLAVKPAVGKPGKPVKEPAAKSAAARAVDEKSAKPRKAAPKPQASDAAQPVLLSGGNPQIAKGYGDAPVQAYIAAMPGWKSELGRRLDGLIESTVPGVRKAVKWNSPFYGMAEQGWFLSFHCFTRYVKVAFFRGASLRPVPPGKSKQKDVRYLDIYENDQFDEELVASWIRQASELPGESLF